jgi:NDP-sugar pyrophosphorylase family protein
VRHHRLAHTLLSLTYTYARARRRKSKWSSPSSGLKIVPILTAKETFSPGDALRDIYTHGIITSDFVLVSGDLVSSVRIEDAVAVHRERRRKNKDVIMTMVVRESGARHRTKYVSCRAGFALRARLNAFTGRAATRAYT